MQMGVDVNRANQAVSGIAARSVVFGNARLACMIIRSTTATSLQVMLKGVVAEVVGGAGTCRAL